MKAGLMRSQCGQGLQSLTKRNMRLPWLGAIRESEGSGDGSASRRSE